MDYASSAHINDWAFTSQQLSEVRTRANNEAYHFVQQRKQQQVQQESSSDAATATATGTNTSISPPIGKSFAKGYNKPAGTIAESDSISIPESDRPSFPTPEEEVTLVEFYAEKLLTLIGPNASIPKLKRDIKVASTASILLRRFFLSNSVTIFDPKTIMVACAFLASKVEDATCDIRYLEDGTKAMSAHVKIKDIIEAEIALVKGVDFDLCCFHPYKVVLAYTEDLRTFLKSKDGKSCVNREFVSGEDLVPIYNRAREIVEHVIFHSDDMMLASPGKVGFAAMMLANKELVERDDNVMKNEASSVPVVKIDFKGYLKCRFANEKKEHEIETLWQAMEGMLNQMGPTVKKPEPDMVVLKGIHKKLKKYRIWGKGDGAKKKKKRKRTDVDTAGK